MAEMVLLIQCDDCGNRFPPSQSQTAVLEGRTVCGFCGKWHQDDRATLLAPQPSPHNPFTDLKFKVTNARAITRHFSNLDATQINQAIEPAACSFARNMQRAVGAVDLLVYAVGQSVVLQQHFSEVEYTKSDLETVQERFASRYEYRKHITFRGNVALDLVVSQQTPFGIGSAVQALLSSQIVMCWTALEALTEDIWVRCLNARPRLALIAINAEPLDTDDEQTAEQKRRRSVPIPTEMVRMSGFVIQERMGDIVSRMKKWDFAKRGDAIAAYKSVFGGESEEIATILDTDETRHLAAIRNNLVHNAGIADQEFRKLMKSHPTLSTIPFGEAVPIDGDLVSAMTNLADSVGVSLIQKVSNWLDKNPT